MKIDRDTTSRVLTSVVANLASAKDLSDISRIVADAAQILVGANATTIAIREGQHCFYADENALSPFLKGKRFPLDACISGWAILKEEVVVLKDVAASSLAANDIYNLHVKSLCIVPIRPAMPIGAIGCYWVMPFEPSEKQLYALQVLADTTAVALENVMLKKAIAERLASPPKSFVKGPFNVDIATQRVSLVNEIGERMEPALTPTEARLLIYFMQNEGEIFSRKELVNNIWRDSNQVSVNTIDTHLSTLRKKIGYASKYIKNVPRKGFCFRYEAPAPVPQQPPSATPALIP